MIVEVCDFAVLSREGADAGHMGDRPRRCCGSKEPARAGVRQRPCPRAPTCSPRRRAEHERASGVRRQPATLTRPHGRAGHAGPPCTRRGLPRPVSGRARARGARHAARAPAGGRAGGGRGARRAGAAGRRPSAGPPLKAQARFGVVARLGSDLAPAAQILRILGELAARPSAWRVRVPGGDPAAAARRLATSGRGTSPSRSPNDDASTLAALASVQR